MFIKAQKTKVKGYDVVFDSKTEAVAFLMLIKCGLTVIVKPEWVRLPHGPYQYDFLVTNEDKNIRYALEIKGNMNDRIGIEKANYLNQYPDSSQYNIKGCLLLNKVEYTQMAYSLDKVKPLNLSTVVAIALKIELDKWNRNIHDVWDNNNYINVSRFNTGYTNVHEDSLFNTDDEIALPDDEEIAFDENYVDDDKIPF